MNLLKKCRIKKNFILSIIPARKGSKGLKNKHLKKLNGKELISFTFDLANKLKKYIDKTILCSNDASVINIAKKKNICVPFLRPKAISLDTSASSEYVMHTIKWFLNTRKFLPNYILILQPTNPLRQLSDVKKAIKIIKRKKNIKSLVSVSQPLQHPAECFYLNKRKLPKMVKIPSTKKNYGLTNRQSRAETFFIDGSIYIFSIDFFLKSRSFFSKNSYLYEIQKLRAVDINDFDDMKLARLLLKNQK